MPSSVVSVSRTLGAGGEGLAQQVSKELGFRYVDDEIVLRAADMAGVSPAEVAKAEHKRPLIERILQAMSMGEGGALAPEVAGTTGIEAWARTADHEAMIRAAIEETATEGRVVIVAHGASIAQAGLAGLLRILVTASPGTRAERVAAAEQLTQGEAQRAVRDSDGERRDYLRRLYGVTEELPTHYDIVLNTDVLTLEQATRIVVGAAR